jgi:hypothetical protein
MSASISWNSDGEVEIKAGKSFVTPLGVFEFGAHERLVPRRGFTHVVIQDRRTGEEKVYEVSGNEEITIQAPGQVHIKDRRIVCDISNGTPNSITFGSTSIASATTTPPAQSINGGDLSGRWTASNGAEVTLSDHTEMVTLTMLATGDLEWGEAHLFRDADELRGTMRAIFRNDPRKVTRESQIVLTVLNSDSLKGSADFVKWDRWGNEIAREKLPLRIRRSR